MKIPLIRPYISMLEVEDDFREIFASGIFTRGPRVAAFARELAQYTGAEHAFTLTSATTALWLCLKALGVGPGDEVVVSDFSFPASANVIEDLGAIPRFADVSLDTFNMRPESLARNLSERTKAVIFVDALGNPSGLGEIAEICRTRAIPLIEDAACALGSAENGVKCGSIADLTCFSFHPRKLLTTGEGGAITTNRSDWSAWMEMKLNHGGVRRENGWEFQSFGYNFRMNEFQATLGLRQIPKLDAIIQRRQETLGHYSAALSPLGFRAQASGAGVRHNVQSMTFQVPPGLKRDSLITDLKSRDIESSMGTYCVSGTPYFREKYRQVQPNAWQLEQTTLTLPGYDGVNWSAVVDAIEQFVRNR